LAYVNGNLAMKPNRRSQEEIVIRETTKKVIRKKSIPAKEKLLYMFTVVVFTVIAGALLLRYAQIYDINLQIKQVNTEIKATNIEVQQLERDVQTLSNPLRIREIAESQGMVNGMDSGIVLRTKSTDNKTASLD